MYRIDFKAYGLKLYWQGDLLNWENLDEKLYIDRSGEIFKKEFNFEVNGKPVKGWVGILAKGYTGREEAGFSIIQANRVINGWPKAYKPSTVFGDQEGGTNNLVNQRVIGELYLDGFAVSHTKDQILWQDNEQEEIEEKLGEICKDTIYFAERISFKNERINDDQLTIFRDHAVDFVKSELKSYELNNFLVSTTPPPEKIIDVSYHRIINSVIAESDEAYIDVELGEEPNALNVRVFFSENSEFEPYVVIDLSSQDDVVNVVINTLHPHYQDIQNAETLLNFVRQCIYDGVAEWKAIKLLGEIKPNTVKFLKDGLLRIPFEIKQNSFKAGVS